LPNGTAVCGSNFAYWTGCRRGEILSLLWSQVDLLEKVVRLKTGDTQTTTAA
jgi:integrase